MELIRAQKKKEAPEKLPQSFTGRERNPHTRGSSCFVPWPYCLAIGLDLRSKMGPSLLQLGRGFTLFISVGIRSLSQDNISHEYVLYPGRSFKKNFQVGIMCTIPCDNSLLPSSLIVNIVPSLLPISSMQRSNARYSLSDVARFVISEQT